MSDIGDMIEDPGRGRRQVSASGVKMAWPGVFGLAEKMASLEDANADLTRQLAAKDAEIVRLREAIKAMRDKLETPIKHEVGVKAGPPGEFFTCRACGSSLGKDGKHHENCLLLKPAAQAETGEPT